MICCVDLMFVVVLLELVVCVMMVVWFGVLWVGCGEL